MTVTPVLLLLECAYNRGDRSGEASRALLLRLQAVVK